MRLEGILTSSGEKEGNSSLLRAGSGAPPLIFVCVHHDRDSSDELLRAKSTFLGPKEHS